MRLQIDLQNCRLTEENSLYIEKSVKRLDRYLPDFVRNNPRLYIFIEGHDIKDHFNGSISLFLPKQILNVHFKSLHLDTALKLGFKKIKREIREYKGQHFKGSSEYPSRNETFMEEE